jgi:heme exporter protein C
VVGGLGLGLLIVGQYMGLFVAPAERMMGDVGRILYVHVPAAWLTLVTFTFGFFAAFGHMMTGRRALDWVTEATTEVGVMLNALLLILGSIFARPTWGTWWTWDPRLTSSAVMLLTFVGVMLLRSAVRDPERRATWTSVATILAYVNIPITYLSVRWWRSLHQVQSSPETVAAPMVLILRLNAFAFLFLTIWFIARRWRIAKARDLADLPMPLEIP